MDGEGEKRVYEVFNRVFRTGEPEKDFDYELIRKDGSRVPIEVSVSLIRDKNGRPAGFRGLSRDITARKRTEEALQQEREEIPPDRREHPRHLLPVRPRGKARHGEPIRADQDGL